MRTARFGGAGGRGTRPSSGAREGPPRAWQRHARRIQGCAPAVAGRARGARPAPSEAVRSYLRRDPGSPVACNRCPIPRNLKAARSDGPNQYYAPSGCTDVARAWYLVARPLRSRSHCRRTPWLAKLSGAVSPSEILHSRLRGSGLEQWSPTPLSPRHDDWRGPCHFRQRR